MKRELSPIETTARLLRQEAQALLDETGLLTLLARYGRPNLTGSFVTHLMVWRDLDMELISEGLSVDDFFKLGAELAATLKPARMSFRNERIMETPALPRGIYLPGTAAWKIDLWSVDPDEQERRCEYPRWLQRSLTDETRKTILEIKTAVWSDPDYRMRYSAKDVYDAVPTAGVTDPQGFYSYLSSRTNA